MLETHPGQADPTGNFVGDVLPVDVSYPGAGDVLHATTAHPDLQRRRDQTSRVREQENPDKMSERVLRQRAITSPRTDKDDRDSKSQGGGAQLASTAFKSL